MIKLRRGGLFYFLNLVFLCLIIFLVSFLGFFLPLESGERINFQTTIFLTLVFLRSDDRWRDATHAEVHSIVRYVYVFASILFVCICSRFNQTRLPVVGTLRLANDMANQSVDCRLWRASTLLRGFNFSGTFLHHIVAWPSGNSSTKNHEDSPRWSPPTGALNARG